VLCSPRVSFSGNETGKFDRLENTISKAETKKHDYERCIHDKNTIRFFQKHDFFSKNTIQTR